MSQISSSFYGYLSRLRWIKRWGLKRNTHEENVMEHSWEVATIALYHDITEVITGVYQPLLNIILQRSAAPISKLKRRQKWSCCNCSPISYVLILNKQLIRHEHLSAEQQQIIKAADKISAYLKCQAELKAGNREFEQAAAQLQLHIQQSEQMEVIFFMQTFAPNCALTLDGLLQTN